MIALRNPLACLLALFLLVHSALAQSEQGKSTSPRIRLRDDSTLLGRLVTTENPQTLRWLSPHFHTPFEFPLSRVAAIYFPARNQPTATRGAFGFELVGGNQLEGDLIAIDDDVITVRLVDRDDPIHIDRKFVQRIVRQQPGAGLVYMGPNGLDGWQQTLPKEGSVFREETGHLVVEQVGSTVLAEELPATVECEVEISWTGKPDFALDIGGVRDKDHVGALRLEVVQNMLVAIREFGKDADIFPIEQLPTGSGRIRLLMFIDQSKPQFLVYSPAGELKAELAVSAKTTGKWGVRFSRLNPPSGDNNTARLERLKISSWSGERPMAVETAKSRVHQTSGTIAYGQVSRYSSDSKEISIATDNGPVQVPIEQVASIFLSEPTQLEPRGVAIAGHSGVRLNGVPSQVTEDLIQLGIPGVRESLSIAIADIRALVVVEPPTTPTEIPPEIRVGTLQMNDEFIRGWLTDGRRANGQGCLIWQPVESHHAAVLKNGESGRIVFREPPPRVSEAERRQRRAMEMQNQVQVRAGVAGVGERMVQALAGRAGQKGPAAKPGKPLLHLRTGDTIACTSINVDESGVIIESDATDAKRIPHERVKLVELIPSPPNDVTLRKSKKEPLLTLPRIQRPSPPTQLLRSTTGDFLRGRVTAITPENIQLEVRLENREISRKLVSHVFWLHPDETDPSKATPDSTASDLNTRVQAFRADGFRLTFDAVELAQGVLSGTSFTLGACKVELNTIDQLMIGAGIEQAVAQLAYHRWRLKNAIDPRFVTEGDEETPDRNVGTDSPLVGKVAPDFELELLAGEKFKLSANKGKIIVLDFWATWCGPCVRAMPLVEAACKKFPGDQVQLIAVNLQEQPKQIKAMLERHKLDVTVALDVDGVVADRYQASAIPQTVVIDQQGKIARLFVGGGGNLGDQISAAVDSLLNPDGNQSKDGNPQ